MAHDFVEEGLQIESQTGRVSFQIVATLLGGVMMVAAFIALLLFEDEAHPNFLAMIAAILLGAPLVWVALKDLASGHMHFNELVALAVLAAFAMGEYHESAAIAFFMIISVLIESRTALGAQASIESLVKITPTKAHRLVDGKEEEADARDLREGDVVRVRPGDNIPADGVVRSGSSTVNQANITGESIPAEKSEGEDVFGGTINLTGVMEIEVTKAGEDTTLGRVKDMILEAERTRIPIARMIDRYSGYYTPTVLMVCGIVWFVANRMGWEDPNKRVISMLVLACPCALILATPTAMVAALSSAARLGVLVKNVVSFEAARNLTAMIFDKTGTLTTGQLQVTKLTPADGVDGADLLQTAASVEQNSKHPVAKAVCDVARKARLHLTAPQNFEEVSGRGVTGKVDGRHVAIGRANWLASDESGLLLAPGQAALIRTAQDSPETEGLSTLFVVRDGQLLGWVGLEDNAREGAAEAVDELRDIGLKRLIIVTGDRESVARRVAAQMHTEYKAEVLPQEKLEMVDLLKDKGHRVAVIGDGVNDAPALAAGDISIAMGAAGSDVAIHSASIALMNNNLNRIPFLVNLSRKTSTIVKQNLAIGFGFIIIFMGAAAADLVSPILAAILHVLSGMVVIFNSARLVRTGEDIEHAEAEALREVTQLQTTPAPEDDHDHGHGGAGLAPA